MENSQYANIIKDIKVLDEQAVPHSNQSLTLIIGEPDGNRRLEFQVKRALHSDKMVTLLINDISSALKLSVKPLSNLRNLHISIKNTLLNIYDPLSRPVRYQAPIFDIRSIEPNNIAHLMMHAILFCLNAIRLSGADTKFLVAKISPPFKKLLGTFEIEPITARQKISMDI